MKKLLQLILFCLVVVPGVSSAAESLRPFLLGSNAVAGYEETIKIVKKSLQREGYEIVGSYSPYEDVTLVVITDRSLVKAAEKSSKWGCDAGLLVALQRVAITKIGKRVQVSFTDPAYMAAAYQAEGDFQWQRTKLMKALGKQKAYGSAKGKTKSALESYQYTWGLEYCDDTLNLATYQSHAQALKSINAALKDNKGGAEKAYQYNFKGKKMSIFGIGMKGDGLGNDENIMNVIDSTNIKHSAHLPYELFVIDRKVLALHPRFRIAINFPDLKMVGKNSFVEIMNAPDAITKALTLAAGGTEVEEIEEEGDPFDDF
jgi:hypothetical protein